MALVSADELRAIKSTTIENLDPFTNAADVLTSEINSRFGKSFDEERLMLIALWLSAHFLSVSDPVLTKEKFENAENTYQRGHAFLAGILSTHYGQTANTLAEGCLVEWDKQDTDVLRA